MNHSDSATILRQLFILVLLLSSVSAQAQDRPNFELANREGYRVNIYSRLDPLQINRIHSWELEVLDPQGSVVRNAEVSVSGGMPDHDHGMPTSPQVTGLLANGRYLLEGVRFHMPGRWVLVVDVTAGGVSITVELEFSL